MTHDDRFDENGNPRQRFRITCLRNRQQHDIAAPTAEAAIETMRRRMRDVTAPEWDRYAQPTDTFHARPLLSWTEFCAWVTCGSRRVVREQAIMDGDGEVILTFDDGSKAFMETPIESTPDLSEVTPGSEYVGPTAIWVEESKS